MYISLIVRDNCNFGTFLERYLHKYLGSTLKLKYLLTYKPINRGDDKKILNQTSPSTYMPKNP